MAASVARQSIPSWSVLHGPLASIGERAHSSTQSCALWTWSGGATSRRKRWRCSELCVKSGGKLQRSRVSTTLAMASSAVEVTGSEKRLTKQDLVDYLASGCKPKEQWKIGTEHEKFGFELETHKPLTHEQIQRMLEAVVDRFGGEPIVEEGKVIGVKGGAQSITLEPGGQVELSGAPLRSIQETEAEIKVHLEQLNAVAGEMGFGFIGLGALPDFRQEEVPAMPKSRYTTSTLDFIGRKGRDVAFRTCSVQVNLDFFSEQDMVRKFRASLALQPVATALFANSPFLEGKPNGFASYRSQIYEDWDSRRTSNLPQVFHQGFGFDMYVEYALDVPMFFTSRGDEYVDCQGGSFRRFMEGKLEQMPGRFPTIKDWESHLGTIYTEVRLKKILEMRGADVGPLPMLCALPALWVGLLYDEQSLQGALDIVGDWTQVERDTMRARVGELGLRTSFRDGLLSHVAQEVVRLAREGLRRRGLGEEVYLDVLQDVVTTGVAPSEDLLHRYRTDWGESIEPVYTELRY